MVTDSEFKPWITLRHVAEDDQVTDMIPESFVPLTYPNVVQKHNNHRVEFTGETTILKGGIPERVSATFSMDIAFHKHVAIYALVEGGWLPVPFVQPGIFLVDQNVLITLSKIADGRIKPDKRDLWLSFMNNARLVINPVFCAWEGTARRQPTYPEFCDRFDEASARISAVLPKASMIKFEEVHYQAAYASIIGFTERQEKETEFLLHAVPLITNRAPTAKLMDVQRNLLEKAKKLGLSDRSLAVVAVFSCLFEKQDGSGFLVGRKILKPKRSYTDQDAYNALCDLRTLELYICSRTIGHEPMFLCTRDRAMAAFWCLIGPHSVLYQNGKFTYSLRFSGDLFPRLSLEGLRMFLSDLATPDDKV